MPFFNYYDKKKHQNKNDVQVLSGLFLCKLLLRTLRSANWGDCFIEAVFKFDNLLVFYGVKYQYFVKQNPRESVLSFKSAF